LIYRNMRRRTSQEATPDGSTSFIFTHNYIVVRWEGGSPEDTQRLCALAADSAGKLNILGHDGDTLGMDSAKVGVLEKANKVSLGSLLQSQERSALEAKLGLEVLADLTHKALEGQLANQKVSGLLVFADLTKSHGTGAVSVGFLL
jgi:hypothetical protein